MTMVDRWIRGTPQVSRALRGLFALLSLGIAEVLVSRQAHGQYAKSTIAVDLGSGVIPGTLPFDVPFVLSAPARLAAVIAPMLSRT